MGPLPLSLHDVCLPLKREDQGPPLPKIRCPICSRFTIKTRTQNLNLLISAKTLEATCADSFCAHQPDSKGGAFGAFSWFVLCRAAKNEHQKTSRERAKLGERPATQKEKNLARPKQKRRFPTGISSFVHFTLNPLAARRSFRSSSLPNV